MLFRFPKDDRQYSWTSHSKSKMLHYRISDQKVKLILKNPDRRETGIAPKTIAVMKRNDTPKRKEEMWVMYQTKRGTLTAPPHTKIISTWRYPGVSPKNNIPIPEGVLEELALEEADSLR